MANSIKVSVKMSPNFEKEVMAMPRVAGECTRVANQIAERANTMASEVSGIWHETGKPHNPNRTGGTWHGNRNVTETVGGTRANYGAKPAKRMGTDGKPVAIVFTANHAAMKDQFKNNTLLKAKG